MSFSSKKDVTKFFQSQIESLRDRIAEMKGPIRDNYEFEIRKFEDDFQGESNEHISVAHYLADLGADYAKLSGSIESLTNTLYDQTTELKGEVQKSSGKASLYLKIAIGVAVLLIVALVVVVGLYAGGIIKVATMEAFPGWQAGLGPDISEKGPPYVPLPPVRFLAADGGPANPPGQWYNTGMNGPNSETYMTPFKAVEFPQQQLFYRYRYSG